MYVCASQGLLQSHLLEALRGAHPGTEVDGNEASLAATEAHWQPAGGATKPSGKVSNAKWNAHELAELQATLEATVSAAGENTELVRGLVEGRR